MNQTKVVTAFSAFALVSLLVGSAHAGTATANLGVSAEVSDNCIISTADVSFGAYDPIAANAAVPLNGTGTVTITCTTGASAVVTLGLGANDAGGTADDPARRMASGADFLDYTLYSDGARTSEWGNTAGTGVADTGDGAASLHTVYGSVAPGQTDAPEGNYSDTVVATVTF